MCRWHREVAHGRGSQHVDVDIPSRRGMREISRVPGDLAGGRARTRRTSPGTQLAVEVAIDGHPSGASVRGARRWIHPRDRRRRPRRRRIDPPARVVVSLRDPPHRRRRRRRVVSLRRHHPRRPIRGCRNKALPSGSPPVPRISLLPR